MRQSKKERWLPNLRQSTLFVSANEKAPSHGAGLTKQVYKQFPKMEYYMYK
jgi:hypothetical protein